MKKSLVYFWGILVIVGMVVSGCTKVNDPEGDQPPVGVSNELDAIKFLASGDEFVENTDKTMADAQIQPADYGTFGFGKVNEAITPIRFGRFITRVTKTVTPNILPGDTIAVALIEKNVVGIFKIKAVNANGDTLPLIEKPFNDASKRRVVFKRVDRNTRTYWRNWVPVATSLVAGGTVATPGAGDISITKLVLVGGTDSVTITNPLDYWMRFKWSHRLNDASADVFEMRGGERLRVRATVVSKSALADMVVLRFGFDRLNNRRVKLDMISETANGDGTFTRLYSTPTSRTISMHAHPGKFNAVVDAVTRGTVFDDTIPYSVSFWGVPYRVL